jgi:hypothetical protein
MVDLHLELYSYNEQTQCTVFYLFHYRACTCFGLFLAHHQ